MKKLICLGVIVVCLPAVPVFADQATEAPKRGDQVRTVRALGTLEPEELVDVGAQVGGVIQEFGQDPRDPKRSIDYGSPVLQGTVLARIDPRLYEAQVEAAKAKLERAEAALKVEEARLAGAEKAVQKVQKESAPGVKVEASDEAATALEVARAQAGLSQAEVRVAQADLKQAQINLGYCTIVSPVKGVVIDRRVTIGQTVVSSLNAPTLFLIARDLKRLQVWVSVPEADIANIHPGQPATFIVEAFPNQKFKGVVAPDQPRLNAAMTQGKVTYTVVVNTDNSSGRLLPYLTADVTIEVNRGQK